VVRLARNNPATGLPGGERTYYVMDGLVLLGRVRWNDGWNAAAWDDEAGHWETIAGTWRTRGSAVDGVVDEIASR
jgi:hypothetical protein